jgi:membrane-bound acyltransferase YfiQ involved in biofilm formation
MIVIFLAFHAFAGGERESFSWFLSHIPITLINGMGPLWYIPFISILFLFSPLFYYIPNKIKLKVFPFLLLLPLLGTRTDTDITFGQYLYFAPMYLFGMYMSLKFETLMQLVKKYMKLMLAVAIIATAFIFWFWYSGYDTQTTPEYLALLYIRNMILACCILYFLRLKKDHYKPWLDKLAVYSFALFFTHYFIHIKITRKLLEWAANNTGEIVMFLITLLYIPVFIAMNYFLLYFAKKILGKRSRYIIGA